ncbi:YgjV family protein [Cellulomonas endophytica]|uniref:YgjV family protein n=1 Tax=Cellulomonas endophytica TaxID=2494735 RepID=UPI0010111A56|nr:YgjV family protein [Cellulomonas endophytica]
MPVLEAVGWAGSALLVVSLTQTRVMRFRVLNLLACLVLVGYNAAVGVWPMAVVNVVLATINLVVVVRLLRHRHDDRSYDAVPIAVDAPYLRRLLGRHAADVARFNPTLPPDPLAVADHAFLVSSGDAIVGVVLTRDGATPDEQHVVLDHVLPAFRDFTPGEFVFRPDGPVAALGARRVVASPGMVDSRTYLDAVGFRPEGDRRVLTLPR